jgi:hypothetical protein
MPVYDAMSTLLNLKIDLDDRAAVEAALNGSPCAGEFVGTDLLNRSEEQQQRPPSGEAAFEALMSSPAAAKPVAGSIAISLKGGGEVGFRIAQNPYKDDPVYGPRFIDWVIKAAKANLPGGPRSVRGLNIGQHVPPEFGPSELSEEELKELKEREASGLPF